MSTMQTTLPPRPDLEATPLRPDITEPAPPTTAPTTPAPKKGNYWLHDIGTAVKALLAIIVVGGLMVWGAIAIGTAQREDAEANPAPIEVVEPGMTYEEASNLAAPLMIQAGDELGFITETSAISADGRHLNIAASLIDQAADLFEGIDETQVMYLHNAADHTRAAAVAERAGDFDGMGEEMIAAADDLDTTRAAVPAVASV